MCLSSGCMYQSSINNLSNSFTFGQAVLNVNLIASFSELIFSEFNLLIPKEIREKIKKRKKRYDSLSMRPYQIGYNRIFYRAKCMISFIYLFRLLVIQS